MIMNSKIESHHQQKTAFVNLRQSTMYQAMHNQKHPAAHAHEKAIDYG